MSNNDIYQIYIAVDSYPDTIKELEEDLKAKYMQVKKLRKSRVKLQEITDVEGKEYAVLYTSNRRVADKYYPDMNFLGVHVDDESFKPIER